MKHPSTCICKGKGYITMVDGTPYACIEEAKKHIETTKTGTLSYQVGGNHYKTMTIEPWEIFDAHPQLTHYECCAIKYILREKPGASRVEELKKAIHYLQHQVELEGRKDNGLNIKIIPAEELNQLCL